MKPGQQFKIDSIEELKEAYVSLTWSKTFPIDRELQIFENSKIYKYVTCDEEGEIYLFRQSDKYETIPNPFKKSKWQRINDILEDPECEKWEDDEEKDPIREELKALREDVEKLKGELTLIKEQELAKEKQEAINKIHEIMRESLATKECCKEKPKESPEQKGMLQINLGKCAFEILSSREWIDVTVKEDKNYASISLEKPEAIKIVNYLKNHFEIKS